MAAQGDWISFERVFNYSNDGTRIFEGLSKNSHLSIAVEQLLDLHFGPDIGQWIGFKKTFIGYNAINILLKAFQRISNSLILHERLDLDFNLERVAE